MIDESRILVTGGNGMVGTSLKSIIPNAIFVSSKDYDLRDRNAAMEMVYDKKPLWIIHLAACVGGVKANSSRVGEFFYDNARININVLDAAKEFYIQYKDVNEYYKDFKLVSLLSTCVYPDKVKYPLTENQLQNGEPHASNFGYAYAKRLLDSMSRAYRKQYGCNFITAVPNNLIGECFSGDTEVIVEGGIKNIKDITVGDLVWTLNPESFEIELSKVIDTQKVFKRESYDVENSRAVDFSVTPEHKFFYKRKKFIKKDIKNLEKSFGKKTGQITFASHIGLKLKQNVDNKISLIKYCDENHIFSEDGKFVRDHYHSSSKWFPIEYDENDFYEFVGWFISEGHMMDYKTKGGKQSISGLSTGQIKISQYATVNEENRKKISFLLDNMGIPYGKDQYSFYFNSRLFRNFINEEIGNGSYNKRIPKFFLKEQKSCCLLKLYTSLMLGDGDKRGTRYSTASKQLAEDFLYICFLLGISNGDIKREKQKFNNKEFDIYRITIRRKRKNKTLKFKNIKKVITEIERPFYCFTAEKNNIICAGRNKKFNWIGQCDNYSLEDSHIIPAVIRKLYEAKLNNTDAVMWGSGEGFREFTYSKDIGKILLFLLENYNEAYPINIGNTEEFQIKDIVEVLSGMIGFEGNIVWDSSQPAGQLRKPSSNLKLKRVGWKKKNYTDVIWALRNIVLYFTENYPNLRGVTK